MIALPQTVLDLLDAGKTRIRGTILFEFGTGTYGFIKSDAPYTTGGITYQPGGLIQISSLTSSVGMAAQQFTVSLAASPDDGLTPEVLQTIENEDYRDRPVTVSDLHFHPDTGAFLFHEVLRRGYVDVIDHDDSASQGYTIIASCETRALDYTRTNGRLRTTADQQRRAPGDEFYTPASMRGREEVFWGRKRSSDSNSNGGGSIRFNDRGITGTS